jgi:hypothetical protein
VFSHRDQLVFLSTREGRATWTSDFQHPAWRTLKVYDVDRESPIGDNFVIVGDELWAFSARLDGGRTSPWVRKLGLGFLGR